LINEWKDEGLTKGLAYALYSRLCDLIDSTAVVLRKTHNINLIEIKKFKHHIARVTEILTQAKFYFWP